MKPINIKKYAAQLFFTLLVLLAVACAGETSQPSVPTIFVAPTIALPPTATLEPCPQGYVPEDDATIANYVTDKNVSGPDLASHYRVYTSGIYGELVHPTGSSDIYALSFTYCNGVYMMSLTNVDDALVSGQATTTNAPADTGGASCFTAGLQVSLQGGGAQGIPFYGNDGGINGYIYPGSYYVMSGGSNPVVCTDNQCTQQYQIHAQDVTCSP